MQRMLADSVALAHEHGAGLPVRIRSIRRPPAEALLDASSTAELLVIGTSLRLAPESASLGPVGHDVLLNLAGPTVVVHEDDETAELLD